MEQSRLASFGMLLCIGCGGMTLKEASTKSAPQIDREVRESVDTDPQLFTTNRSYEGIPEYWLGTVALIETDSTSKCAENPEKAKLQWLVDAVYSESPTPTSPSTQPSAPSDGPPSPAVAPYNYVKSLGYPVSAKNTEHKILMQSIVTRQVALNVQALSVVSGELSDESVAEVVYSKTSSQRIPGSAALTKAVDGFVKRNKTLIPDAKVCWLLMVVGYTEGYLVRKVHTKSAAKAGGGYAGVKVGGEYYASTSDFRETYVTGLSLRVIRHPDGDRPSGPNTPPDPAKPTPEDAKKLQPLFLDKALPDPPKKN